MLSTGTTRLVPSSTHTENQRSSAASVHSFVINYLAGVNEVLFRPGHQQEAQDMFDDSSNNDEDFHEENDSGFKNLHIRHFRRNFYVEKKI